MPPPSQDRAISGSRYVDFYKATYAQFPIKHRARGSIPLDMIHVEQGSHETRDLFKDECVLALVTRADVKNARVDAGDGALESVAKPGAIHFAAPRGSILYSVDGPHSLLIGVLNERKLTAVCDEDGIDIAAALRVLNGKERFDPLIARTIAELWYELAEADRASTLLIDGMTQSLLARIYRIGGADLRRRRTSQLDDRRLSRAMQLIDAAVADADFGAGLTVEKLATELGLSQFHFMRSFKARTGMTPYQCLMMRRLDRARELLEHSTAPIADVAYACGFSSQAHMTSAFSKHIGTTPGRYRRVTKS